MLNPSMKRLSVLIAVATVDMMGLMMVAPLMPFYALKFHAPEWMIGPLISAFAMAQLVASPVWGRVSDRHGRRPALLIGLGAAGVAFLIFGFASSLWMLFVSRIGAGIADAFAALGAELAVTGATQQECDGSPHRAIAADVRDDAAMTRIIGDMARLDVLVKE